MINSLNSDHSDTLKSSNTSNIFFYSSNWVSWLSGLSGPLAFNYFMIKLFIACKIADHLLQRNITFMKKQNLNPYDLNRSEYAELLGITPNAVRMRMRHGKLEGEYKLENGKYFFRAPQGPRENQGLTSGQKTTLKKIYRRGNHYKANYPNEAFRKHNEAKMLAKLKHSVDDEVQALLPEAIEIAKNKKRERIEETQRSIMNDRTTNSQYVSLFNESNPGYGSIQYHSAHAHLFNPQKFRNTPREKPKPKKGPYEI